jgi:membrane protein YdbS with pleckstrin-like domain
MTTVELRAPAHHVSRRARLYWTVRAVVGWVVVGALETGVLFVAGASRRVDIAVVAVTAVLAAGHLVVMPQWRYRVHRWEITETAAYTQVGWFTQERRVAPLARVQTVDTQRGPIEQLFNLSNVTVTTASAKGPIKIHALDRPVAEHIVHWLTERAQQSRGDGT